MVKFGKAYRKRLRTLEKDLDRAKHIGKKLENPKVMFISPEAKLLVWRFLVKRMEKRLGKYKATFGEGDNVSELNTRIESLSKKLEETWQKTTLFHKTMGIALSSVFPLSMSLISYMIFNMAYKGFRYGMTAIDSDLHLLNQTLPHLAILNIATVVLLKAKEKIKELEEIQKSMNKK